MPAAATQKVWKGSKALRRHLVPVGSLEPFEGNPRRGDVAILVESFERFGQVRPVLTDAATPNRIVAGHHMVLAAVELGWTHVAAIAGEFASEEEARRYLLMDNRSHDLGGYDLELLSAQLVRLREDGGVAGTGYGADDLERIREELAEQQRLLGLGPGGEQPRLDQLNPPRTLVCPACGHEFQEGTG